MNLSERLRYWAQNEEMIDQHFTAHGRDCNEAASLIAAAPDLLAALEGFLSLCPSNEGLGGYAPRAAFNVYGEKARAAIAKAKGEA